MKIELPPPETATLLPVEGDEPTRLGDDVGDVEDGVDEPNLLPLEVVVAGLLANPEPVLVVVVAVEEVGPTLFALPRPRPTRFGEDEDGGAPSDFVGPARTPEPTTLLPLPPPTKFGEEEVDEVAPIAAIRLATEPFGGC